MVDQLHRVGVDLVNVVDGQDRIVTTLAWGDDVVVAGREGQRVTVRVPALVGDDGSFAPQLRTGFIPKATSKTLVPADGTAAPKVLRVDFVDVQQGDGAVVETPGGQVVLVDGGENQLFARYLASRFRGTSAAAPREIDCMVVTHGDADHFRGLVRIQESEAHANPVKRLFVHPRRVYHNGLVKRPTSVAELESFGATQAGPDGAPVVTGLESDLLAVPAGQLNRPFRAWQRALEAFATRGPIEFRRLAAGDDDAFGFLAAEGVRVEVLGPVVTSVGGVPGLPFLRTPPDRVGRTAGPVRFGALSAGHTINGHSVILRLTFGAVRILLAGDLNEQVEAELVAAHQAGRIDLTAEVLKVPHHGSADFSPEFLRDVSAAVSVVSSGDESARTEFIHPRANLMCALGRHARPALDHPLVFVTELAAFFKAEGYVTPAPPSPPEPGREPGRGREETTRRRRPFFAFTRQSFGMVRVRTDGRRLLVYTYSGKDDMKEAYAFTVGDGGAIESDRVTKV